jgi:hypothetical protein
LNAYVLLRSESIVATPDSLLSLALLRDKFEGQISLAYVQCLKVLADRSCVCLQLCVLTGVLEPLD